jgi:copper oxidase (laccase) domain-containing protein
VLHKSINDNYREKYSTVVDLQDKIALQRQRHSRTVTDTDEKYSGKEWLQSKP